jgi:hypothetical protein
VAGNYAQFNDDHLDWSENALIMRTIAAAGKSCDRATWIEYRDAYLRMRAAMRFAEWEPLPAAKAN